jgi:hypothetical protein
LRQTADFNRHCDLLIDILNHTSGLPGSKGKTVDAKINIKGICLNAGDSITGIFSFCLI